MNTNLIPVAFCPSAFWTKLSIMFIAYFSPIAPIVHCMLIFLAIDTISGIWASHKEGNRIESRKLRKTVYKFIWYTVAIMASYMMERTFHLCWSNLSSIIGGFICFVELKSIFENITRITNEPVFLRILLIFKKKTTETIDEVMDGDKNESKTTK